MGLLTDDNDKAFRVCPTVIRSTLKQRMVDIAAEKGVTLTVDEVKGFLSRWMRTVSLTILSIT